MNFTLSFSPELLALLLCAGVLCQGVYVLWPRRLSFALALTGAAAVAVAALHDRDMTLLLGQALALLLLRARWA